MDWTGLDWTGFFMFFFLLFSFVLKLHVFQQKKQKFCIWPIFWLIYTNNLILLLPLNWIYLYPGLVFICVLTLGVKQRVHCNNCFFPFNVQQSNCRFCFYHAWNPERIGRGQQMGIFPMPITWKVGRGQQMDIFFFFSCFLVFFSFLYQI